MSALQLLWYGIICLLFIGFICLEGADFGVGMSFLFLSKEKQQQDAFVSAIEPTWDGSEVWLVTAVGGMFASFPVWYGSLLSGYYLLFLLLILSLIIRGVSIHFRLEMGSKGNRFFDKGLFIGSLLPPFVLGVIFASMSSGIAINSQGHVEESLLSYFTLYTIAAGILVGLTSLLHGLNFLALKTSGVLRDNVIVFRKRWENITAIFSLVFVVLLVFSTGYFDKHAIYTVLLIIMMTIGLASQFKKNTKSDWFKLLGTALMFISEFLLLITGSFPNVITSNNPIGNSITIQEASSSPQTLKLMTVIALILVPIILIYQVYAFSVFRKRITI